MSVQSAVTFLVSAVLTTSPAVAQQPAAPPQSQTTQIIVEGARNRDEQITTFINALTPAPIRGQLSRFEAPICPKVSGLADAQAVQIKERMRRVAAAIGLPVAGDHCKPNMVVYLADNKQALLEKIGRSPGAFPEEWSGATIRQFELDPSPVAAWQMESDTWQDSLEVTGNERVAPVTNMGPEHGHTLTASHGLGTRLMPSARKTIGKAVVVISFNALAGLDSTQLADYALMRALVRTEPADVKALQSRTILNLFNAAPGTPVAASLTAWDLSFLKAFYASSMNNYAEYQRAQMKGLMERELDKTEQR
jgi:hypothetical protein